MPSEPTKAEQTTSTLQTASDPTPTSHHGHHLLDDDGSQHSLLPHAQELQGEAESSTGGNGRDAMRTNAVENGGLRGAGPATPPYRDRISHYETARAYSPQKTSEGPLFEVIRSNRSPDDNTSPIAKLPNGTRTPSTHSATGYA